MEKTEKKNHNGLHKNTAIRVGLDHFFTYARNSQKQNKKGISLISHIYDNFKNLEEREIKLVESAQTLDLAADDRKFANALEAYEISEKEAKEAIKR